MEFLKSVLKFLDEDMETPTAFGWFHLLFIALAIVGAVVLCLLHKKNDPDRVRRIIFITAIAVLVLEMYKQINYSFSYSGEVIEFDYQWYAFPFQFCSTPMYVGLLAGIIKKGRVHDALCAYLATYALFAGVCVMVYPGDVFIGTIGINIQTMICHGSMISIGAYLLYSGHVKLQHKTILGAVAVFAVCVGSAAVMNEIAYFSGLLESETFNMFFISPHCDPSLPVYSLVQGIVPFPFCLIIYIAAFSLAAYVILLAAMGIKKLSETVHAKQSAKTELKEVKVAH